MITAEISTLMVVNAHRFHRSAYIFYLGRLGWERWVGIL